MRKREDMIDRLKTETSFLKEQQRDKEKEVRKTWPSWKSRSESLMNHSISILDIHATGFSSQTRAGLESDDEKLRRSKETRRRRRE